VAKRFLSPAGAVVITVSAIVFSVPNYSAAVPSWYNLFFATFGTAAILQFLETSRRRWLLLAGLAGGISFLFKLSGLYFVAGALLFFVFREQEADAFEWTRSRAFGYSTFVTVVLGTFLAILFLIARQNLAGLAVFESVVPGALVTAFCLLRQLQPSKAPSPVRFKRLFHLLVPFLIGVALPILIFLIPYCRSHSLADFINGVFILPGRRLTFAVRRPIGLGLNKLVTSVGLALLIWCAYANRIRQRWLQGSIVALLGFSLVLSGREPKLYGVIWTPLLLLIPTSVMAALVLLSKKNSRAFQRQELFLIIAVTATCTLIQVPFSAGIYFLYVAPLLVLSLAAIFSTAQRPSRVLATLLLGFYIAFLIFRVTPGFIYAMGYQYQPSTQSVLLRLPRAGGLRVEAVDASLYEQLIPVIEEHAGDSSFIYAAPDCPEVYFLAGKKNPTRTIFDFFDNPQERTARVLGAIATSNVNVIALLQQPPFSPPISADLSARLHALYPFSKHVGRFEVCWRAPR
jgi:hypothetical protein